MYVDVMGSSYYQYYFGLFYYFSVIIGINIVVAFTLDMYASVERLDQERMRTLEMLEEELTLHNKENECVNSHHHHNHSHGSGSVHAMNQRID